MGLLRLGEGKLLPKMTEETAFVVDYEKDYFDFAQYVSLYGSISFEEARGLYAISDLNGYSRDQVVQDLIANGNVMHKTYRKMVRKMKLSP